LVIGIALLIALLIIGMPIALSLGLAGSLGLMSENVNFMLSILSTSPYRSAANFTLSTIPLFIFMAEILSKAGYATDLFRISYRWIGHLPGGLASSTILSCAMMGSMTGSSSAATAAMARICIPEMDRYGYNRKLSTGVVAFGGTLAVLIPPSIPLVVYGIITETSIGKLLIAGLIPGIVTAVLHCVGIYVLARIRPEMAPSVKAFSWRERFEALKGFWVIGIIIFAVIGSMYFGVATATEAAAIGAVVSLLVAAGSRRIGLKGILEALKETIKITSMIFLIMIGAMVFSYFLTYTGVSQRLAGYVASLDLPAMVIFLIIVAVIILLGFFMEGMAILLTAIPIVFPIVQMLGFDPIWFGIIVIIAGEIGLVTPPVGLNAFIVSTISREPLANVFKGSAVLLIFEAVVLAIIILFPEIALWLPERMK